MLLIVKNKPIQNYHKLNSSQEFAYFTTHIFSIINMHRAIRLCNCELVIACRSQFVRTYFNVIDRLIARSFYNLIAAFTCILMIVLLLLSVHSVRVRRTIQTKFHHLPSIFAYQSICMAYLTPSNEREGKIFASRRFIAMPKKDFWSPKMTPNNRTW